MPICRRYPPFFGLAVLSIKHVACLGGDIGGVVRKNFIFVRTGNASREKLLLPASTAAELSKKFREIFSRSFAVKRQKISLGPGLKQIAGVVGCRQPVISQGQGKISRSRPPDVDYIFAQADLASNGIKNSCRPNTASRQLTRKTKCVQGRSRRWLFAFRGLLCRVLCRWA